MTSSASGNSKVVTEKTHRRCSSPCSSPCKLFAHMEGVGWSEQGVSSPVPAWAMPPRTYGIRFALAYADLDVQRTSRLYGMTSMSLRSVLSFVHAGALTSLRIPVGIVTQLPTRLVFSLSWKALLELVPKFLESRSVRRSLAALRL